MDPLAGGI